MEPLMLVDAANLSDNPHPYLVFVPATGRFYIADDFEPENDPAVRDFVISKAAAENLVLALVNYIACGNTSPHASRSQRDVLDSLASEYS